MHHHGMRVMRSYSGGVIIGLLMVYFNTINGIGQIWNHEIVHKMSRQWLQC